MPIWREYMSLVLLLLVVGGNDALSEGSQQRGQSPVAMLPPPPNSITTTLPVPPNPMLTFPKPMPITTLPPPPKPVTTLPPPPNPTTTLPPTSPPPPNRTTTLPTQPKSTTTFPSPPKQACPSIVSRSSWGAQSPTYPPSSTPTTPGYVFIHHSATPGCTSLSICKASVRCLQTHHIVHNKWWDIGYSFLVGEDGNVYEGRGWGTVGAHTPKYNNKGIGICVIGDFASRLPNKAALDAVKSLIACGVEGGHITTNYVLKGHRDVRATESPGDRRHKNMAALRMSRDIERLSDNFKSRAESLQHAWGWGVTSGG